jgi:hypothetical protein
MKTDPNEPAYPAPEMSMAHFGNTASYLGLTKRETMAMHICAGLMAFPEPIGRAPVRAFMAVEQADALIAALNAKDEP